MTGPREGITCRLCGHHLTWDEYHAGAALEHVCKRRPRVNNWAVLVAVLAVVLLFTGQELQAVVMLGLAALTWSLKP